MSIISVETALSLFCRVLNHIRIELNNFNTDTFAKLITPTVDILNED